MAMTIVGRCRLGCCLPQWASTRSTPQGGARARMDVLQELPANGGYWRDRPARIGRKPIADSFGNFPTGVVPVSRHAGGPPIPEGDDWRYELKFDGYRTA